MLPEPVPLLYFFLKHLCARSFIGDCERLGFVQKMLTLEFERRQISGHVFGSQLERTQLSFLSSSLISPTPFSCKPQSFAFIPSSLSHLHIQPKPCELVIKSSSRHWRVLEQSVLFIASASPALIMFSPACHGRSGNTFFKGRTEDGCRRKIKARGVFTENEGRPSSPHACRGGQRRREGTKRRRKARNFSGKGHE